MPFEAVLGRDLPLILICRKCNAVVTRMRAKQQTESNEILSALPFFNEELETTPRKTRKTHSQRRQEKFHQTVVMPSTNTEPDLPLGLKCKKTLLKCKIMIPL